MFQFHIKRATQFHISHELHFPAGDGRRFSAEQKAGELPPDIAKMRRIHMIAGSAEIGVGRRKAAFLGDQRLSGWSIPIDQRREKAPAWCRNTHGIDRRIFEIMHGRRRSDFDLGLVAPGFEVSVPKHDAGTVHAVDQGIILIEKAQPEARRSFLADGIGNAVRRMANPGLAADPFHLRQGRPFGRVKCSPRSAGFHRRPVIDGLDDDRIKRMQRQPRPFVLV